MRLSRVFFRKVIVNLVWLKGEVGMIRNGIGKVSGGYVEFGVLC